MGRGVGCIHGEFSHFSGCQSIWMSPECLVSDRLETSSDVYAFGMMIFEVRQQFLMLLKTHDYPDLYKPSTFQRDRQTQIHYPRYSR